MTEEITTQTETITETLVKPKRVRRVSKRKSDIIARKKRHTKSINRKKFAHRKYRPLKRKNAKYVYHGKFVPFERARQIVKVLNLRTIREYDEWYAKNKPSYLPKRPDRAYKKVYKGWVHFSQKDTKSALKKFEKMKYFSDLQKKRSKEALKEVAKTKKNISAYIKYEMKMANKRKMTLIEKEQYHLKKYRKLQKKKIRKSNKDTDYKFVRKTPKSSKYMPYDMAVEYLKAQKLNSMPEYQQWYKINKPENLPYNPYKIYGSIKAHEFLSYEKREGLLVVDYRALWRPFDDALIFARSLGLTTALAWDKAFLDGKLPKDIPRCPQYTYRYRPKDPTWGKWINWDHWLGKDDYNLVLEAKKELLKVIMIIVPKNAPNGIYSFVYKSGTPYDINNFIDDNELYVIRIYKIGSYDWQTYIQSRYHTYAGQQNIFLINNINDVLFDLDEYMEQCSL